MEPARRVVQGCIALALACAAVAPAHAQGPAAQPQAQEDRPRRRTPQAPPAPAADATASAGVTGSLARKPVPPGAPRPLPPPVLASAVHSRYGQPAVIARSTAGQCRAQCAEARGQCFNADSVDTSGCDPGWTRCLSTCDGLTYSRGP